MASSGTDSVMLRFREGGSLSAFAARGHPTGSVAPGTWAQRGQASPKLSKNQLICRDYQLMGAPGIEVGESLID